LGLFAYGVLNRLLLVTGLHHIINNVAWFVIGDYQGTTGDLRRFFAGDPTAGAFMAGFFPVMMFGLPAACLAMYHEAKLERRKIVGGLMLSLGLTSFLTGVTEPIEYTFMFLAPMLYAIHAVLTGISMALMDALGVKLGFGFSAGLFDYVLGYGKATRPLLLLPIGAAYALIYYALFRFIIRRFDLKTPGRDDEQESANETVTANAGGRGAAYLAALGGAGNLESVEACTTRLRLIVSDQSVIDEAKLKALGAARRHPPVGQGRSGGSRPDRRFGGDGNQRGYGERRSCPGALPCASRKNCRAARGQALATAVAGSWRRRQYRRCNAARRARSRPGEGYRQGPDDRCRSGRRARPDRAARGDRARPDAAHRLLDLPKSGSGAMTRFQDFSSAERRCKLSSSKKASSASVGPVRPK
jgi:glucose-like phosphotransferase system IIB component